MRINITKTKELVFHRPHPSKYDMPLPLYCIAQQRVAKLLGVFLSVGVRVDISLNTGSECLLETGPKVWVH